ncbi:unnamed protein product, partial [Gulo gulo]
MHTWRHAESRALWKERWAISAENILRPCQRTQAPSAKGQPCQEGVLGWKGRNWEEKGKLYTGYLNFCNGLE